MDEPAELRSIIHSMAHLYKRPDRKNEWWICYRDAHGRRKREQIGRSQEVAYRVLAKRLEEAELEKKLGIRRPEKIYFHDFSEEYLEHYARPNKKSAWRDEITIHKHLEPRFGNLLLSEINAHDIEVYKTRRSRKVAKATVNRELECFKTILSKAVEWGYLLASPATKVKKFPVRNQRLVFLEREEVSSFLEASKPSVRPIFATLIWTGMRKSECFNLKWEGVDLRRRVIQLLDTKWGTRDIPITDDLYEVLSRIPRHISSAYVFPQSNGQPWKDLRGSLASALRLSAIEKHVTLHTFRHTFASHLVMSGADLYTVMELMGHSSLEMIRKHYGHLSPRHKRQAMDRLQRHLRATNEPPELKEADGVPASD